MEFRTEKFWSYSLGENREVRIEGSGEVIAILLHPFGFGRSPFIVGNPSHPIHNSIDRRGVVFVEPDAGLHMTGRSGVELGSWYTDSIYAGKFASFIKEIITHYGRGRRVGLLGASMGGWGAMNIGTGLPDLVCFVGASESPTFFGRSTLDPSVGSKGWSVEMGLREGEATVLLRDMVESLDYVLTDGQLLKTVSVKDGEVQVDEKLYSVWKENSPLRRVIENRHNLELIKLVLAVNFYDRSTLLTDEVLHKDLTAHMTPHEYVVLMGPKVASHVFGINETMRFVIDRFIDFVNESGCSNARG